MLYWNKIVLGLKKMDVVRWIKGKVENILGGGNRESKGVEVRIKYDVFDVGIWLVWLE